MLQYVVQAVQEHAPAVATSVSAFSAVLAWMPFVQDGLQVVATLTAITAGGFAIRLHRAKLRMAGLEKEILEGELDARATDIQRGAATEHSSEGQSLGNHQ